MKTAKILEITSYPPPRSGWGVRVEFLRKRLLETGHTCVVLNLGESRKIPSPEYECVKSGFDYLYKIIKYSALGYTFHLHVNGDTPKGMLLTLAAQIANLLFFRRGVLTFHAGINQIYFPKERSGRYLLPIKLMFMLSKHIICNSDPVKEKIAEYGIYRQKISSIPAFTKQYLQYTEVELETHIESFFARHDPVIFCYIKYRDGFFFETLIEALNELKSSCSDFGILLVGTTTEDIALEKNIRNRIAHYELEPHICEVPDMTHDEFRTALKRSSLYLRTPTTDGVCSSVLEALSFEIPVVASDNGNRPPSTILYNPENPVDMANKLRDVAADLTSVKERLVKPEIKNTLEEEVQLLVTCSES